MLTVVCDQLMLATVCAHNVHLKLYSRVFPLKETPVRHVAVSGLVRDCIYTRCDGGDTARVLFLVQMIRTLWLLRFVCLFVCYQRQSAIAINYYCSVHWCHFLWNVIHSRTGHQDEDMLYSILLVFSDAHNYLLSLSGSITCLRMMRACYRKVRYWNVTIPSCLTQQICIQRWWSWLVK